MDSTVQFGRMCLKRRLNNFLRVCHTLCTIQVCFKDYPYTSQFVHHCAFQHSSKPILGGWFAFVPGAFCFLDSSASHA